MAEHAPHNNTSERKMLNTKNPNAIEIVHRAKISEKWKTMLCWLGLGAPCTGLLCKKNEVWQSTYLQVHENRVEYNYPGIGFNMLSGGCRVRDAVGILYFDRKETQNAERASACTPLCTHCSLFPEMCECCGQTAVIYSDNLLCRKFVMLPGLEDAQEVARQINAAREAARNAPGGKHMDK